MFEDLFRVHAGYAGGQPPRTGRGSKNAFDSTINSSSTRKISRIGIMPKTESISQWATTYSPSLTKRWTRVFSIAERNPERNARKLSAPLPAPETGFSKDMFSAIGNASN